MSDFTTKELHLLAILIEDELLPRRTPSSPLTPTIEAIKSKLDRELRKRWDLRD